MQTQNKNKANTLPALHKLSNRTDELHCSLMQNTTEAKKLKYVTSCNVL